MQETALILYIFVGLFYPVIYAFAKKVREKFLFISAAYGIGLIIQLLFMLALTPLYILDIWFFPQLEILGYTEKIDFIIGFGERVITDSVLWLITPIHVLITLGLPRKYEVFKTMHNKSNQSDAQTSRASV